MNKLLNNLERKFGRYAIPRLTFVMICCYLVGYMLQLINPNIAEFMTLEPGLILRGEVWRIITWIVIPPASLDLSGIGLIFTLIMLVFYLSIGNSLERAWGEFRYNVYILGGMLLTLIAAFISYFVFSAIIGQNVMVGNTFSTYYIVMSMFLAFAATFPEAQVYLYFIIPIKVKWLGILYFAMMVYEAGANVRYIMAGYIVHWIPIIAMVAALLNFFIFFFSTRDFRRYSPQERKRRRDFQRGIEEGRRRYENNVNRARGSQSANANYRNPFQQRAAGKTGFASQSGAAVFKPTRHRCEICGRTEASDPDLEFRFCSKCEGNHEYCMEHLYTHTHIITSKSTDSDEHLQNQ